MSQAISFRNVHKVFPGAEETIALKGMSFEIPKGSIAALYGPSGSGKSTVLNIASGMDTVTEGEVFVGQTILNNLSAQELTLFRRKHMGFVFQAYNLFPALSAVENVEMISLLQGISPSLARTAAVQALEKVGLSHRLNHKPSELSGGQQQRVAVARSIASKPDILFADEPTANLDSTTAVALIDLLFQLNKEHGTTILFSTHDEQILSRVQKLFKIKDGEILD